MHAFAYVLRDRVGFNEVGSAIGIVTVGHSPISNFKTMYKRRIIRILLQNKYFPKIIHSTDVNFELMMMCVRELVLLISIQIHNFSDSWAGYSTANRFTDLVRWKFNWNLSTKIGSN